VTGEGVVVVLWKILPWSIEFGKKLPAVSALGCFPVNISVLKTEKFVVRTKLLTCLQELFLLRIFPPPAVSLNIRGTRVFHRSLDGAEPDPPPHLVGVSLSVAHKLFADGSSLILSHEGTWIS